MDLPGQALDAQIAARRKALGLAPVPAKGAPSPGASPKAAPVWGLALSGGGIRSAVFGFGVVVALARNRVLLRFDLLSTVSGGSFIGGLIGRLFDRERSPGGAGRVQDALADADKRWFTWWLRANGHYLFARGAREGFIAAAVMLRNLVALHVELALLAVSAGAAVPEPDHPPWRRPVQPRPQGLVHDRRCRRRAARRRTVLDADSRA
jgi:predicted acylesterase/phospholipase RssA